MENGRETPGRRRDRGAARANRLALDPPSRRSVNSGAEGPFYRFVASCTCGRDCSCRSSMCVRTPRSSADFPPRRRRPGGTESSSMTTCAGGSRFWRSPTPGSRLAAIAAATQAIRLGPMVTPLARRRPVKVARETVTLDRLSDGRLTLGVGLGSDRFGNEFSITGEELDDRRRASMLDDALEILTAAWSGEPVHHRGQHFMVDGMRFLPSRFSGLGSRCGWAGTREAKPAAPCGPVPGVLPGRPRAPEQVAEIVAELTTLRRQIGRDLAEPYDAVVALPPGTDPAPDMSPVLRGGWWSSRWTGCRWTACASDPRWICAVALIAVDRRAWRNAPAPGWKPQVERSENLFETPRFLPVPPGRTRRKGRRLSSTFLQVEATRRLGA
jgi:hypothetical protein